MAQINVTLTIVKNCLVYDLECVESVDDEDSVDGFESVFESGVDEFDLGEVGGEVEVFFVVGNYV